MLSTFDLATLFLFLAAALGWINRRFLKLPHAIGLVLTSNVAALGLMAAEHLAPSEALLRFILDALGSIDFTELVMQGMLAFLLFASCLDVDVGALRRRALPIAMLAIVGTTVSTIIVGLAFWGVAEAVGSAVPLAWCLVFGALISPTDPVAVVASLRAVDLPQSLETELKGEALFNDGVALILFTLLVGTAVGAPDVEFSLRSIGLLALKEVGGGIVLGLVTGVISVRALAAIDDFAVEVMITLALVCATYSIARHVGVSGPLSVVTAGLVVGHTAPARALSRNSERYVRALWNLIDDILNSLLFLLIGLQVLVLRGSGEHLLSSLLAIPIVLVGRLAAVAAPLVLMPGSRFFSVANAPFLTWAGMRGGISVVLALALPASAAKETVLAATYAVVLFTILVQASTLGAVARRTVPGTGSDDRQPDGSSTQQK